MNNLCSILWAIIPLPLLAQLTQVTGITDAAKIADMARDKDITWLSLFITACAIGYAVWLNKSKDKTTETVIAALVDSSKANAILATSVDRLRERIQKSDHKPYDEDIDRRVRDSHPDAKL